MLRSGTRIGPYEVLARIGRGGMGEVWRATDTRLHREVALKALPEALSREPGAMARLEREAELLATLNHPHVATIHGLEEQDGALVIVMELVEGDTLEVRLRHGRIPIAEALPLAVQIAQALEAAHANGVIHRDLKPSNIKITPSQRIKVLDFGIAKLLAGPAVGNETLPAARTDPDAIVGTLAYMSPEQARAEAVGVQSDVWSFGVVLFEMLTGVSPFARATMADTIASVLEAQPDYAALPPATPPIVTRLLQRCLARDRSRRFQHLGEVRVLLEEAAASSGAVAAPLTATPASRAWWVATGMATAALAGTIGWIVTRPPPPAAATPGVLHVSLPFRGQPSLTPYGSHHVAISPDGGTVAFTERERLWIRRLDQTDGFAVAIDQSKSPFFSPDGEWIGVFLGTSLAKVPAAGGTPVTLAEVTDRPAGGTWSADGTIVYATSEALYQIPAAGGARRSIAVPDRSRKELQFVSPHFLPGGQRLLVAVVSETGGAGTHIDALDLGTGQRRTVVQGSSPIYVAGHLLYVADEVLQAAAFDPATAILTGKPVAFPNLPITVSPENGVADIAASESGTLISLRLPNRSVRVLEWIDRNGRVEQLPLEPEVYYNPTLSPDGTRAAVERMTRGNRDVWIVDLARMTQTQLTDGPTEDILPMWTSDSKRVYFASRRGGNFDVYSQAADGASPARLEFANPETQMPNALSPDHRYLLVYDRFKEIGMVDLSNPDRMQRLIHGNFDARLAELSPDGRWVAYESDESGEQVEIVLRSFPDVNERRETISTGGGRYPRWSRRGNELYYVGSNGAMMAVPVTLSPRLALGRATKLFDWQRPPSNVTGRAFDVARDGRFIATRQTEPNVDPTTSVSVMLNWSSVLAAAPK